MKKSMATFLLQNKIKNGNHDIPKTFLDDKRTPPVKKCDNDDVIKGCPCMHSVLSAIIRDDMLDLIQPIVSSAHSCVCTVCTVARPAHAISCCPVT